MARKYMSMTELAEAFRSGELQRDHWMLILDNDASFLTYVGPTPAGEDEDEYEQKMYEHGSTLFRGNGYSDYQQAVEAAGIPCEWC